MELVKAGCLGRAVQNHKMIRVKGMLGEEELRASKIVSTTGCFRPYKERCQSSGLEGIEEAD